MFKYYYIFLHLWQGCDAGTRFLQVCSLCLDFQLYSHLLARCCKKLFRAHHSSSMSGSGVWAASLLSYLDSIFLACCNSAFWQKSINCAYCIDLSQSMLHHSSSEQRLPSDGRPVCLPHSAQY